MRWSPLCLLILLVGCQKETPPASPVAPLLAKVDRWQQEADRLGQLVKVGMTKDEVVRVMGEPKEARGVFGSRSHGYWLYTLTSNLWFRVDFDDHERVENRRAWSALPGVQ